jgi:hypothetical protein
MMYGAQAALADVASICDQIGFVAPNQEMQFQAMEARHKVELMRQLAFEVQQSANLLAINSERLPSIVLATTTIVP